MYDLRLTGKKKNKNTFYFELSTVFRECLEKFIYQPVGVVGGVSNKWF